MKSGVKRHNSYSEAKVKKWLATQDDRSNVVWRRRRDQGVAGLVSRAGRRGWWIQL